MKHAREDYNRIQDPAGLIPDGEPVFLIRGKDIARIKYLAIIKGGYDTRTLDKSSQTFIPMELSATPEQIAAGVKAYVDSQIDRRTFRLKDDGKFIPHLGTWLGRAGWDDWL